MATNTPNLNLIKPDLTDPVDVGDINSNMDTLDELGLGYRYVDQIRYTSNGTFVKANYPWLRAIRVRCVGGGGGGGGSEGVAAGGSGGGGGAYAESFITDIAGLDASVTVTRGGGGAGTTGAGNNGEVSSFGSLVTANPGGFGARNVVGQPGTTGVGDIIFAGTGGSIGSRDTTTTDSSRQWGGAGGSSHLGGGGAGQVPGAANNDGNPGGLYGGGGGGARTDQSFNRTGGAGANGIVIVDLFA